MTFYGDLFGWQFQPYFPDYWGVITGADDEPGISGGLTVRQGPRPEAGQPLSSFVCTIDVPSVDEYVERAVAGGGGIAVPKAAIPGMAWLAYCFDTEGNMFGMYQEDTSAQ